MTVEQKAKAYDEALERAREARQNTESAVTIGILEEIFPELRESEDGRMKKELIKFLQECHNIDSGFFSRYCEIPFAQMLAWLEKQGQKPVEENMGNLGGISSNSEWSKEDDEHIEWIIDSLIDYDTIADLSIGIKQEIDWLKNIKQRFGE